MWIMYRGPANKRKIERPKERWNNRVKDGLVSNKYQKLGRISSKRKRIEKNSKNIYLWKQSNVNVIMS